MNGSYQEQKPVKLPTFLQYCKNAPDTVLKGTLFPIELIWLPGKIDCITIQTHAFRINANADTNLYNAVLDYFNGEDSKGVVPMQCVKILSLGALEYEITTHSKKKGSWEELGQNGRKFVLP